MLMVQWRSLVLSYECSESRRDRCFMPAAGVIKPLAPLHDFLASEGADVSVDGSMMLLGMAVCSHN